MPNILKCQKAFWFLFFFPCALSPRKGMLGVSFLLFIGVLLRHTSCLFCMVFAKKPASCVRKSFTIFCLQLWTSRGFFPSLFPFFLILYSGCRTCNQHAGLFLRCTIKELSLCLTPLLSLLRFGGLAFCLLAADGKEGLVALVFEAARPCGGPRGLGSNGRKDSEPAGPSPKGEFLPFGFA